MINEELIARLRDACYLAFDEGTNDYQTAIDAADRIEALTAERDDHWKSFVHWRKEADALTEQLEAARADAKEAEAYAEELEAQVATLTAQVEAMRGALIAEREENLWNAYNTGYERNGRWSHAFMSDGEWLAHECGFDARDGDYPADAIKAAIPEAAKRAALARIRGGV